ncbi:MAG: toll/interleukin-1 receptor domain-containing protein, partial [Aphanizomenon sp.]
MGQFKFDVFLCHNSQDKTAVIEIAQQLKLTQIKPWLDDWELQPGLPWQPELEKQIPNIKSAAVFIGQSGIGPWQEEEINSFLREFHRRKCPVIPILLPNAPQKPKLPLFLEGRT